jgi:hypothetical protein
MKWLLAAILGLYVSESTANCKVYVPVKVFTYAGIDIVFDFSVPFKQKGYVEVTSLGQADYLLNLSDEEVIGQYFHKAKGTYEFFNLSSQKRIFNISYQKTCFTQECAVSDYRSVWSKGYKQLQSTLPICKSS